MLPEETKFQVDWLLDKGKLIKATSQAGTVLIGIDPRDFSGRPASGVGDVNGDGVADLVIGASRANGRAGERYVVFGNPSGFGASLELSMLTGTNGFVL